MRVLCAMSGGVDSSVAAALLRDQGHDVSGVTLKLWGGESDSGCCSVSDVEDARRVAHQLGIAHHVFNFGDDFTANVVDHYVAEHAANRTPNPCIECNRSIKFDRLLKRARVLGFDALATGHHARVLRGAGGQLRVGRGADSAKDQSYVLHMLDQRQLADVMFPVGEMEKTTVRTIATELALRTASKPDSQEVCFIAGGRPGRGDFLADRIPMTPTRVVDADGNRVGEVAARELVTVGQRRGLGLAGGTAPRFVLDIDAEAETITVGPPAGLLADETPVAQVTWSSEPVAEGAAVLVQTSAHGDAEPATFAGESVQWATPHRRVAPGQSVVLYDLTNAYVLGGGVVGTGRPRDSA